MELILSSITENFTLKNSDNNVFIKGVKKKKQVDVLVCSHWLVSTDWISLHHIFTLDPIQINVQKMSTIFSYTGTPHRKMLSIKKNERMTRE